MNLTLRRVPAADLDRLRSDETFLAAMTATAFGGDFLAEAAAGLPWYTRLLFRLFIKGKVQLPAVPPAATMPDAATTETLGLHKSWHGLHWLICQDAWQGPEPLRFALLGADEVGEDLGYGPPSMSSPQVVASVALELGRLSEAVLLERFDGPKMEELEIYPGGWTEDRSWRGDLRRDYRRLQDFYARAAKDGDGMLSWIS